MYLKVHLQQVDVRSLELIETLSDSFIDLLGRVGWGVGPFTESKLSGDNCILSPALQGSPQNLLRPCITLSIKITSYMPNSGCSTKFAIVF